MILEFKVTKKEWKERKDSKNKLTSKKSNIKNKKKPLPQNFKAMGIMIVKSDIH